MQDTNPYDRKNWSLRNLRREFVVAFLAFFSLGIFFLGGHLFMDDVCDKQCELKKQTKTYTDTESKLIQAQLDLEQSKTITAEKQKLYDAAYREYLRVVAERNGMLDLLTGAASVYPKEFMAYIEYPVPMYDPESTGYVAFIGDVTTGKLRYMNLAYQLGGVDFVLTLHAENQTRDPTKQSDCYGPKCEGKESGLPREESYGFCQLNRKQYDGFIKSEFFRKPEYQLIKCWNEYKKALNQGNIYSKFSGYKIRKEYSQYFVFPQ